MKYYTDNGLLEKKWVRDYCNGIWQECIRYLLEENGTYHPDNMLPDGTIDQDLGNIRN